MKKVIVITVILAALVIVLCGCDLQKKTTETKSEPTESGNVNYTATIPSGTGKTYTASPDGSIELIKDQGKEV